MIPSALVLNVAMSFAALSALCLSLNRHHSEVLQSRSGKGRVAILRMAGWAGIGASAVLAVNAEGWVFAPVQWIGATTCAAVLLVLLMSYRPRLVPSVAVTSLFFVGAGMVFA